MSKRTMVAPHKKPQSQPPKLPPRPFKGGKTVDVEKRKPVLGENLPVRRGRKSKRG